MYPMDNENDHVDDDDDDDDECACDVTWCITKNFNQHFISFTQEAFFNEYMPT